MRNTGLANLKKPQSTEEARTWGRAGGIKSGEARREKRTMRQWAELMRDLPPPKWAAKTSGVECETYGAATVAAMYAEAAKGGVQAFRALVETMGETDTAPKVSICSPFVLGTIPADMVTKAKAEHEARQLENNRQ